MKVTHSIVQHEFIGLHAKIVRSPNLGYIDISGKIIDETRNTLVIAQKGDRKIIVKDQAILHLIFPDQTVVEIDGKIIVGRPEERVKKQLRRRW